MLPGDAPSHAHHALQPGEERAVGRPRPETPAAQDAEAAAPGAAAVLEFSKSSCESPGLTLLLPGTNPRFPGEARPGEWTCKENDDSESHVYEVPGAPQTKPHPTHKQLLILSGSETHGSLSFAGRIMPRMGGQRAPPRECRSLMFAPLQQSH